ncbi:MAG: GTPase Era [Bdellovibrionaceae bacterium]|nr:GTPase Era [Bdellovibrio sp.]
MAFKAGFLGLIGQPNAGKSSLMNYLIDQKVSIVTAKPQTTRRRILGIHTDKAAQIIFIDAPGIVKAEKGLNAFLEREALDVISESDVLLAVLSIDEKDADSTLRIIELVKNSKKPWMAVITKTDVSEKAHRIMIIKNMVESLGIQCLQVSILKDGKAGRNNILDNLKTLLPDSPAPLYDSELYTTENVKDLVAEIVREKCFLHLSQELPYQMAVQVRQFNEDTKPCPKIYVDVIVGKESHKPIVIGQGAQIIKKISQEAREEVEKLMDQKVFLELNVIVRENWYDHNQTMKELGYVIERK